MDIQKLYDRIMSGNGEDVYEEFVQELSRECAENHINAIFIDRFDWEQASNLVSNNEIAEHRHGYEKLIFAKDEGSDKWIPVRPQDITFGQEIELRAGMQHLETHGIKEANWSAIGKVESCVIGSDINRDVFIKTNKGLFTNSRDFTWEFYQAINARNEKLFNFSIPGAEDRFLESERRRKASEPIPKVSVHDINTSDLEYIFGRMDKGGVFDDMAHLSEKITRMDVSKPDIDKADLEASDWVNQKKFAMAMAHYVSSRDIKAFAFDGYDFETANYYAGGSGVYSGWKRHESPQCIFAHEGDDWLPVSTRYLHLCHGQEIEMMVKLNRLDNEAIRDAQWTNLGTIKDAFTNDFTGEVFMLTDKGMFTNSKDFEIGYKELLRERNENEIEIADR